MTDQQKQSLIAVLSAAHHNANMVFDQVYSLNDTFPMPDVLKELDEAVKAIKKALDELDG